MKSFRAPRRSGGGTLPIGVLIIVMILALMAVRFISQPNPEAKAQHSRQVWRSSLVNFQ